MFEYCTAVIIEPRRHKALRYVLQNFLRNLPENWSIIVFHGCDNKDYVSRLQTDRVTLFNLNIKNLTTQAYSALLKSEQFYQNIPTETFLVFQTDSLLLDENKHQLESFLQYDYVGAPWSYKFAHGGSVGNGGLSLRKKSKMLEIIKKKGSRQEPEDVYFSLNIDPSIRYNVPSFDLAKNFGVEAVFAEEPFGIHKCWQYVHVDARIEKLLKRYPAIKELMALQGTE